MCFLFTFMQVISNIRVAIRDVNNHAPYFMCAPYFKTVSEVGRRLCHTSGIGYLKEKEKQILFRERNFVVKLSVSVNLFSLQLHQEHFSVILSLSWNFEIFCFALN